MLTSLRMQKSAAAAAMFVTVLFTTSQALWAMGPGRLLPSGTVKVYRGDQLVSVLSEEAPVPEGALLAPEGQCGLRMENLFLVAEDGSRFSIAGSESGRELLIQQGVVYFAVNSATGPLAFHTPDGVVTIQSMVLNAAADGGLLKAYVDAAPDGTRMGVLDGGSLVVLTADGEKTISSGRQIMLAQATLFDEEQPAQQVAQNEEPQDGNQGTDDDDKIPAAYFWGGGALLAVGAGALAFGNSGGGGGGGVFIPPASPSNP